uniref:Uncharacterized protein n=1 Tax=Anguilla anguilla TaxID=7936 RepID=A0A0E9TF64_ANGAN
MPINTFLHLAVSFGGNICFVVAPKALIRPKGIYSAQPEKPEVMLGSSRGI